MPRKIKQSQCEQLAASRKRNAKKILLQGLSTGSLKHIFVLDKEDCDDIKQVIFMAAVAEISFCDNELRFKLCNGSKYWFNYIQYDFSRSGSKLVVKKDWPDVEDED